MRWQALVLLAACSGSAASSDAAIRDAPTVASDALADSPFSDAPIHDAPTADAAVDTLPDASVPAAVLAISPVFKDFGTILLVCGSAPTTFTVTNIGDAATTVLSDSTTGTNAGAFAITQDDCNGISLAPNESCTLAVAVAPSGVGFEFATLKVSAGSIETAAALSVSRNATVPLGVSPSTHAFLGVPLGSSASASFTVTNQTWCPTSGPISVTGPVGANPGMFSLTNDTCSGLTLAGGESCTFGAVFAPTASGPQSASIEIEASPGGLLQVGMLGSAPGLTIGPATTDFGTVAAGMTSYLQQTISVFNGGPATDTLSVSATGDAAMFALIDMCTGALAAGAGCTLLVTFAPTAPGTFDAQYIVTGSSGGMVSVAVHGVGGPPANFAIEPRHKDYESCEHVPRPFIVTNVGPTTKGPIAATIVGTDSGSFAIGQDACSGTSLAPNASCTVYVSSVMSLPAGQKLGELRISAPGAQDAFSELSGYSVEGLEASTCLLLFDNVAPGSTATQSFTVTNESMTTTGTIQMLMGGADTALFPTIGCVGQTLGPFQSCTITVTYAPTVTSHPYPESDVQLVANPGGGTYVDVRGN